MRSQMGGMLLPPRPGLLAQTAPLITNNQARSARLCHPPLAAILAREPLRVAAADELVLGRVPLEARAMPVGHVHQVAADRAAGADAHIADRLLAALHARQEILELVLAVVELHLRVRQQLALGQRVFALQARAL